jgi:outer membrane protein assembly factor BamB
MAVAGNEVYAGLTNGGNGDIMVLNAANLTPLGLGVAGGEGVTAPPFVVDGDMYVGTLAGNFYKVPLSGGDAGLFGPNLGFETTPTYDAATGRFFIGSDDGSVCGF